MKTPWDQASGTADIWPIELASWSINHLPTITKQEISYSIPYLFTKTMVTSPEIAKPVYGDTFNYVNRDPFYSTALSPTTPYRIVAAARGSTTRPVAHWRIADEARSGVPERSFPLAREDRAHQLMGQLREDRRNLQRAQSSPGRPSPGEERHSRISSVLLEISATTKS